MHGKKEFGDDARIEALTDGAAVVAPGPMALVSLARHAAALLAIRKVSTLVGVHRGLDAVVDL